MCSSRKCQYLPHGMSMEIPKGRGWGKAKILKKNWNFQRGGRVQSKRPSVGCMDIFSGTTHTAEHVSTKF